MGWQETVYEKIMSEGIRRLQARTDLKGFREESGATAERIVRILILDVKRPPIVTMFTRGQIVLIQDTVEPDITLKITHMKYLLNIIRKPELIDGVVTTGGMVRDGGREVLGFDWEGDILACSTIMKKFLKAYAKVLDELLNELGIMGKLIHPVAAVKASLNRSVEPSIFKDNTGRPTG